MTNSMNRVFIMGRLTRDPTAKRLTALAAGRPDGQAGSVVGELSVAVTESHRNREGATVETTCFVDVVAWNKQAEVCETYLRKGSSVLVEGRLQLDEWEDKEGQKRSKLRVRADRIHFMDPPRKKEVNAAQAEPAVA